MTADREQPSAVIGDSPPRGYSWETFADGNIKAMRHGAYSDRAVRPVAARLKADLRRQVPWVRGAANEPTLDDWATASAMLSLVVDYLDYAGVLTGVGEDGDRAPRAAMALADRLMGRVSRLREELGLGNANVAELALTVAQAKATAGFADRMERSAQDVLDLLDHLDLAEDGIVAELAAGDAARVTDVAVEAQRADLAELIRATRAGVLKPPPDR